MDNIIFIGGIHGVGKTTICNDLANTYFLSVYSASEIISNAKKQFFSSNKLISDIEDNQLYLINWINSTESVYDHSLLDGHFCLMNEAGVVSKIPEFVFHQIKPIAFIVIVDEISSIIKRLEKRDHIHYDAAFLEKFQYEELEYSKLLAEKLNIPLHIYNQNEKSKDLLHNFITDLGVER